jgi:hypothetical protein
MGRAFPEAVVDGYARLTGAMKNNLKDRHVLAPAVKCGAQCIVSNNKALSPNLMSNVSRLTNSSSISFI